MFRCGGCGGDTAVYDRTKHAFVYKCGHESPVTPERERCWRCGTVNTVYTWFDPSGCPKCGRSRDD